MPENQKAVSDSLELEFYLVVKHLSWKQGTRRGLSERAVRAFTHCGISPTLFSAIFLKNIFYSPGSVNIMFGLRKCPAT